jgi:hypothetical protein
VLFHGTNDFILASAAGRGEMLQLVWAVLLVVLTAAVLLRERFTG